MKEVIFNCMISSHTLASLLPSTVWALHNPLEIPLFVWWPRRDFFLLFCKLRDVSLPTEPCALGSTQPLKMSTRDFSWGKGGRCLKLTTYDPCSAERQENPWP